MRYDRLFSLAVFAFIAACSSTDSARTPTGPGSVTRPSAAISLTTDPRTLHLAPISRRVRSVARSAPARASRSPAPRSSLLESATPTPT